MSERGRRGQETGSRIKFLRDTLSQGDGTQPLPSAGDQEAEGNRPGDSAVGRVQEWRYCKVIMFSVL